MNDQWTDRLSDYLDDELPAGERAALEAHLATCSECRTTLGELRQGVARAQALEDAEPETDLWRGIATAIGMGKVTELAERREKRARRFAFSIPQLIAASIGLVLLSGGATWMALRNQQADAGVAQLTPEPGERGMVNVSYDSRWRNRTAVAIAELQDELTANEAQLDTATVRIVRQNLAVIDRAISQAQKALQRDPNSAYLQLHLANTMRQKVELLRRANNLAVTES